MGSVEIQRAQVCCFLAGAAFGDACRVLDCRALDIDPGRFIRSVRGFARKTAARRKSAREKIISGQICKQDARFDRMIRLPPAIRRQETRGPRSDRLGGNVSRVTTESSQWLFLSRDERSSTDVS